MGPAARAQSDRARRHDPGDGQRGDAATRRGTVRRHGMRVVFGIYVVLVVAGIVLCAAVGLAHR